MTYEAWNSGKQPEGSTVVASSNSRVRVCTITDVECSRQCYSGPCKVERLLPVEETLDALACYALNADAEAIKRLLESAIQRSGAGKLADALVAAGAGPILMTLAAYSAPLVKR